MKKTRITLIIGLLIVATFLFFNYCSKEKVKSFGKNSYYEVTAKLNQGGNFYMYLSTEKVIKSVEKFALKIRKLIETNMPDSKAEKKEFLMIFDFIFNLIKKCGLTEISGIGMSSVAMDSKLNHSKIVIHHYKDKGSGLIWHMMEEKPNDLNELQMLPADTVLAKFSDFKIKTLWEWIKKEAEASNLPKLKKAILSIEPTLQKQGIDFNKLLNSFEGRFGFVLSLDSKKNSKIPIGKTIIEIPEPALAIVFSIKDDYIIDLLQKKLPFPQKPEEKNKKKIEIPIPARLPIPLKPMILQKEGLLFFASNNKIVDDMFAAKENGNGLTSTNEFKKLSANMPKKGNNFRFTSKRLSHHIIEIQNKALQSAGKKNEKLAIQKELMSLFQKESAMYGVLQNTSEGHVYTFNHNMRFEYVILLPAVAVPGIVAAIAIPNLLTALQKGKQKATMGDMKSISLAIESYITDNYYAPQGRTMEDLTKKLQPFYIRRLPLKDGWGNNFKYFHGTGTQKKVYFIGSGGRDGIFKGWDQNGYYIVRNIKDFNKDIIVANGVFKYGPKIK